MLQLDQLLGTGVDEQLNGVLVGQVIAAPNGVESMEVEIVILPHHGRRSTLRRDGMAAHGIDLGHHRNIQRRLNLDSCSSSPQSCRPSTND